MGFDIPNGWALRKVGEIAEVVGGGTPSTKDVSNFEGGSIPWITPKDLSGYRFRAIGRGERNITEKGLATSSAKLLPVGSVLLTTRAPIGYVAIAINPLATNQGFHSLVLKEGYSPELIYYRLKSMTEILKANAGGTTFGELSGSTLKQIEILLPPLPEQRRIASILGALDDKIELNHEMNKTLEEMAQAIFKSWFVDFEPFRDGEFEYNEELGMEIPKGWGVGKLEDLVTISTKGIKPFEKPHTLYQHFSIPAFDEGKIPTLEKGVNIKSNKHVIERDCVLVSKLNPRFPRVWRPSLVDGMTSICSTEFIVYEGKREKLTDFLYWLFRSQYFSDLMLSHVTGTTGSRQRVKPSVTLSFRIIIPPDNIVEEFVKTSGVISKQVQMNLEENQNLAAIRDALPPKLLSGEIRINVENAIKSGNLRMET